MSFSRTNKIFFMSALVLSAVCFAMICGRAPAQDETTRPPAEQKTFAQSAAEKTDQAAHAAADATSEAAHRVAETADKAYRSATEKAERAYDSAAETTQKAFQSAATTTEEAAGAAREKAADAAERVRYTANRPVTETEVAHKTTNALLVFGGVFLAAFLVWMVYRSLYPRDVPPGERTYVGRS